jgi:hypothetical protein
MKPHQQRVVDEQAELDDKIVKLTEFINCNFSDLFKALPDDEQRRLRSQKNAMETYSQILGERIDNF